LIDGGRTLCLNVPVRVSTGRVDYIQQDEEDFQGLRDTPSRLRRSQPTHRCGDWVVYGAGRAQGAVDRHPLVSVDEPDKGHSEVAPAEEVWGPGGGVSSWSRGRHPRAAAFGGTPPPANRRSCGCGRSFRTFVGL